MFTVEERDRVRDRILALARADARVVAGAEIGSLAHGGGDRWSDLDLGFGVASGTSPAELLADWTETLSYKLGAVQLFDLPSSSTTYRVFLFPRYLQVDVSVTPADDFGPRGPKFRLLFGRAADRPAVEPPAAEHLFGLAVHHVVRAWFCLQRGLPWQAQYWIAAVRDEALSIACRSRGLEVGHGRGYDALPLEVLAEFEATLVRSLHPEELLRALRRAVDGLLREAEGVVDLATTLDGQLRRLVSA